MNGIWELIRLTHEKNMLKEPKIMREEDLNVGIAAKFNNKKIMFSNYARDVIRGNYCILLKIYRMILGDFT